MDPITSYQQANISEERMRFALNAAGIGLWDLDPINNIVEWDERCRQLYGFPPDEVITYEQVLQYTHPDDLERLAQAVTAVLTPGSAGDFDIEYRVIGASDGKTRWLHTTGKAYFNQEGIAHRFSGISRDISEEKRKEEALRNVEKRFQTAFDHAALGIVISDVEGKIIMANKAFADMLGYNQEELYNQDFLDITHPEDVNVSREMVMTLLSGLAESDTLFKRYIGKNGDTIWTSLYTTLVKDENGNDDCFFSIIQDITEEIAWKEEQQRLLLRVAQSESRFRMMIEQAPVAIALMKTEKLIIEAANDEMLKLWGGKKAAAIIGKTFLHALPEMQGQGFDDLLLNVYSSGQPHYGYDTAARIMHNGELELRFFNFVYAPVSEGPGETSGIIVIATDTTGQVQARKKLVESEKRFRTLVEEAPVATAVYWGEDMVIETANDAMIRLWGKTCDVIGKKLEDALPELEGQPFLGLLKNVYHTGITYKTEDQAAHLIVDGELKTFYFNFTYKPLKNSKGEVYAILNMAVDITSKKMVEQELERKVLERTEQLYNTNKSLEEANAHLLKSNLELEQYAYVVSHDMQEPARKILTFSEMLESTLGNERAPRTQLYLSKVQASAARMLTLIKDLLSFSHLSNAQRNFVPVSLNHLLDQVLIDLELLIEQKNALIQCDDLPEIEAIPLQISQLFYNLVNNALKFSREGVPPKLTIQYKPIENGLIELHFSDNGIGFEKEYEEKIFALFQRLHDRSRFEGTGIGLALCRKVVENHGGTINAKSVYGQGSDFIVVLPLRQTRSSS